MRVENKFASDKVFKRSEGVIQIITTEKYLRVKVSD